MIRINRFLNFTFVALMVFLSFTDYLLAFGSNNNSIKVGAERMELYLPILSNKTVAIVANQTSVVGDVHLVDTLLSLGINIGKVFSPEHGFRGILDAGEDVNSYTDKKTGLPIVSLYGNNYKPKKDDLKGIDMVIFDIQDVGVRFYTYISTLHYVMEACAENDISLLLLDRPNPNGFFVDGPIREDSFKSFVGLHPVPLVHGMTIAEYAKMINGRGWLKNEVQCTLIHILCEGYTHSDYYELPIKPSPNLPNMTAVYLYPSLGLFEGTMVSVGRGTEKPFQVIGHPTLNTGSYKFTPKGMSGAKNPPYKGQLCNGHDLGKFGSMVIRNYKSIYLYWLTGAYRETPEKDQFFNNYFNTLAGTDKLKDQIEKEVPEEEIVKSWKSGILEFKKIRKGYLLYPDFE